MSASSAPTGRCIASAELVALPSGTPVRFGVYGASRENARLYLRVVMLDGVIPPQSDVSRFHDLLGTR